MTDPATFIHPSSIVDQGATLGPGCQVWHFCHIMKDAVLGPACNLGQNVFIGGKVQIGANVKIQNNVSVYQGVTIEDDVFLGPSCVLTNIKNPRAQISRKDLYQPTLIRRGATIGANATIVCGVTIGRYAFVAAGAVVTADIPDYALVAGTPARWLRWVSRHGVPLSAPDDLGIMICPETHMRYQLNPDNTVNCMDIGEDDPLPPKWQTGHHSYDEITKGTSTWPPTTHPAPLTTPSPSKTNRSSWNSAPVPDES